MRFNINAPFWRFMDTLRVSSGLIWSTSSR